MIGQQEPVDAGLIRQTRQVEDPTPVAIAKDGTERRQGHRKGRLDDCHVGILTHNGDNGQVRRAISALAVCLIIVIAFLVITNETADTPTPAGTNAPSTTLGLEPTTPSDATDRAPSTTAPQVERFSDLPVISTGELPPEARDVLVLIDNGGPYPYRQDDGIFQNREGILPDRADGHYREYTVETPGSPDRGARRIVGGADGERYYTDDHYGSFSEIVP